MQRLWRALSSRPTLCRRRRPRRRRHFLHILHHLHHHHLLPLLHLLRCTLVACRRRSSRDARFTAVECVQSRDGAADILLTCVASFCAPARAQRKRTRVLTHTKGAVLFAKSKDYYEILGVPRNVSQADLKKAFYQASCLRGAARCAPTTAANKSLVAQARCCDAAPHASGGCTR